MVEEDKINIFMEEIMNKDKFRSSKSNKYFNKIAIYTFAAIFFTISTVDQSFGSQGATLNKALDAYENGGYEKADKLIDKLIKKGGLSKEDKRRALYLQAGSNLKMENYEEAIDKFNVLIESYSGDAKFYFGRGVSYCEIGEYKKSISDFNKKVKLSPEDPKGFFGRGTCNLERGNPNKAILDLSKAIKLSPKDPKLFYNRAGAFYKNEQYEKAVSDYSKVVSIKPEYGQSYLNRAKAYFEMEEYSKALSDLQESLRLKPNNLPAIYYRGLALLNLGKFNSSIENFDDVIRRSPKYKRAHYKRGNAYVGLGNFEKAIDDFTKSLQLYPDYAKTYLKRSVAYFQIGNYEQAISDADAAIANGLEDPKVYFGRGVSHFILGKFQKSASDFEKLLSKEPKNDEARLWFYISYIKSGKGHSPTNKEIASGMDSEKWPGSLLSFLIDDVSFSEISSQTFYKNLNKGTNKYCEFNFFAGEYLIGKGHILKAKKYIRNVVQDCNKRLIESRVAGEELERLNK